MMFLAFPQFLVVMLIIYCIVMCFHVHVSQVAQVVVAHVVCCIVFQFLVPVVLCKSSCV